MAFWALTVVLKLKKHIRLLAGLFLISSASLATWTWYSLGDAVIVECRVRGRIDACAEGGVVSMDGEA